MVGGVEITAHAPGKGVEQRGGRLLGLGRTMGGLLRLNSGRTERGLTRLAAGLGGLGLDSLDHGGNVLPAGLLQQVRPARERREGHGFRFVTSTRAPPSGMKRKLLGMSERCPSQVACQPAIEKLSAWAEEASAGTHELELTEAVDVRH
jgi:hypothetical protein